MFAALTAWLAPMLAFTMEEAWLNRFPDDKGSVHLRQFPEIPPEWRDEELAEKWRKVRAVRRVVTGALEIERKDGRIGSSLEAAPKVHVSDSELREALAGIDLAEIAITSGAELVAGTGPKDAFRLDDVPGVAVVFAPAEGRKCARSWKILRGRLGPRVPRAHPARCGSRAPVRCPQGRRGVSAMLTRWFWGPLSPLGLGVAAATALVDQAHKAWMLYVYDIAAKGIVRIASFFDLVLVWNRGISYGLFPQESPLGRLGPDPVRLRRERGACGVACQGRHEAHGRFDRAHHRRSDRQCDRPHPVWRRGGLLLPARLRIPMVRVQYRRCRHRCRGRGTPV